MVWLEKKCQQMAPRPCFAHACFTLNTECCKFYAEDRVQWVLGSYSDQTVPNGSAQPPESAAHCLIWDIKVAGLQDYASKQ